MLLNDKAFKKKGGWRRRISFLGGVKLVIQVVQEADDLTACRSVDQHGRQASRGVDMHETLEKNISVRFASEHFAHKGNGSSNIIIRFFGVQGIFDRSVAKNDAIIVGAL